jgi:hypothetical protein
LFLEKLLSVLRRKGCQEEEERDVRVTGVRRWRELVIDKEKLRGIFRQAKARNGL